MKADLREVLPMSLGASPQRIESRRQAALITFAELCPCDINEAILAIHAIVAHYTALDDFRVAGRPNVTGALKLRYQGRTLVMMRKYQTTLRELDKRQCNPLIHRPGAAATIPRPTHAAAQPSVPAQPSAQAQALQTTSPSAP